jgi:hypothetical protein
MAWRQGQHVLLVGQTGSGKTTLAKQLLSLRPYRVMLVTKPDDLTYRGWQTVKTAGRVVAGDRAGSAFRLWPEYERQTREFLTLFRQVWNEGCWCVYIDETYYLEKQLGLQSEIVKLLTQGRSKKISVVLGVQRPCWITRFALSEPSHILCARLGDKRDIQTMSDVAGESWANSLRDLKKYDFSYLNKESGDTAILTKDTILDYLGA